MASLVALGLVIAGSPLWTTGDAFAGTTGQGWTGRGACVGGGKLIFAVDEPASGQITVTARTSGLPNGARWDVFISNGGVALVTRKTTKHGGFVVTAKFDPLDAASYDTTATGPHGRRCSMTIDPSGQLVVATRCSSGRHISLRARRQHSTSLTLSSRLARVDPGSSWQSLLSLTDHHSGSAAASIVKAARDGIVRDSTSFDQASWTSLGASFKADTGARCSVTIHRHAAT
jgi:hypothetical protein